MQMQDVVPNFVNHYENMPMQYTCTEIFIAILTDFKNATLALSILSLRLLDFSEKYLLN